MVYLIQGILYLYDVCYRLWHGLFSSHARAGPLLLFHSKKYRGPRVILKDTTTITEGDEVLQLHFDNVCIKRIYDTFSKDREKVYETLTRELTRSLELLAEKMKQEPRFWKINACMGETMLGERAVSFGFELWPVETKKCIERLMLLNARVIIARMRREKLRSSSNSSWVFSRVWISKNQLFERYQTKN